MTDINRNTTAPNGSTFKQFEQFVADLQASGRGALGAFELMDAGNADQGIELNLLCLDNGGCEFHGYYSTATCDAEGGAMPAEHVLGDFWTSCLAAAWAEQDAQDASE